MNGATNSSPTNNTAHNNLFRRSFPRESYTRRYSEQNDLVELKATLLGEAVGLHSLVVNREGSVFRA